MRQTLSLASSVDTVLVGDDTDLLVLLLHYVDDKKPIGDVFLFRMSSSTTIDIKQMLLKIPKPVVQNILFVHAASGCDTTSGHCGIGKCKLLKFLIAKHQLIEELELQFFIQRTLMLKILLG